ncbi:MAG TPA: T9SS type A sorting domain-containing protein, partial [Bacteroidia bacterium]
LSTSDQASNNLNAFVFPNPVKDHFTISLKTNTAARLDIFSAGGKLVMTKELVGENEVVERNELPAGIYFYTVKMKDGKSAAGKLIFQ